MPKRKPIKPLDVFAWAILLIASFVALFPIYWMVTTSFKNPIDVSTFPPPYVPFLQFKPTLDAWNSIMGKEMTVVTLATGGHPGAVMFKVVTNSLIIASCSAALCILIGSLAAYSLARFEFKRWKNNDIAFWILSNRMFPPVALVIPFFLMFRFAGMLDTLPAVILVHTAMNLPFVVWLTREFFLDMPREVEESAMIDGCSVFGVLRSIVLPLAAPALAAVAVFAFIFSWNELLFALFLTYSKAQTLPMFVAGETHSGAPLWWLISAVGTLAIIPPIIFAIIVQKYIIRGLTFGAVKG
jgi:multiple sugar transport system permease protein